MPSANQLRVAIEHQLSRRIPAALSLIATRNIACALTGISEVDKLSGGLPIGALSEVTGACGSGRTALALAAVSTATQAGQVAAWVDVSCSFDPESAAANRVLLDRLLWVRCQYQSLTASRTTSHPTAPAFVAPQTTRVQHGGGSPHPRSEERGLSDAVNTLLASPKHRRDRITGTPGAPNRPLQQTPSPRSKLSLRIEQAGTDRQPSRRGTYVLDQRERFVAAAPAHATAALTGRHSQPGKPWGRIDQALRVTDLLLQAGGFSIIVLDLADITAEFVSRIPMATWFRFRAGAEHAQSALLVLTQHACTGSSSALVLKTQSNSAMNESTYFPGLNFVVEIGRQRFTSHPAPPSIVAMRKPPQRASVAEWKTQAIWTGGL